MPLNFSMARKNIIIFGIIIAVLLAVGILFSMRGIFLQPQGIRPDKKCGEIADDVEKEACISAGYLEWMRGIKSKAIDGKNPTICAQIPDNRDRDICFLEMNDIMGDSALCGNITDAAVKGDCESRLIIRKNDFSSCKDIENKVDRDYCYESAVVKYAGDAQGLCGKLADAERELCWEIYYTNQALLETNYETCKKIATVQGKERCLQRLPKDSDSDGVSDYDEITVFGTDPTNRDSDNDGFDDGVEVKSGNDPLK